MAKNKEYIGKERSIVVEVEIDADDYNDSDFKKTLRAVKKYNVSDKTEKEGFGTLRVEFDASYVTEDFESLKEELMNKLPFAQIEVYDGSMDEEFDDFTYDYSTLQIQI